jgi:hypothetical protein
MSAHRFTIPEQAAYLRESYFAARIYAHDLCKDLQRQHGLPLTCPTKDTLPFTQVLGVLAGRMFGLLQTWEVTQNPEYLTKGVEVADRFERYYALVSQSPPVARHELTHSASHSFVMHTPAQHPSRLCPHSPCDTEYHMEHLEALARQQ